MAPTGVRAGLRAGLAVAAAVLASTVMAAVPAAAAQAAPAQVSPTADFYTPPSSLRGSPGDVIRSEPSQFFLDPLRLTQAPAKATRIMYRSTDHDGQANAVTGTVLTPNVPWFGRGQRPIVSYAVGTQGVGDQCAPSRQLAAGTEYEGGFLAGLLQRGYGVVVTDYAGLGTPGVHTYVNRVDQANAVLDAARAAQRLSGSGLPSDGPVLIAGYSQGGGASAAAAELGSRYSPELNILGAYAGAVPADLAAIAPSIDGGLYSGFLAYVLNSFNFAYPELGIRTILNDRGDQILDESAQQCLIETIARYPLTRSQTLTVDGRSLEQYIAQEPFRTRVAEQRIGNRKPEIPVLLVHSTLDDVIPYAQGRQLGRDWCARGATVRFSTQYTPTHVGTAVTAFPEAFAFLEARVARIPALSNCGAP